LFLCLVVMSDFDPEGAALGDLWQLRENVAFTYHAHFELERKQRDRERWWRKWHAVFASALGAVTTGAVLKLPPSLMKVGAAPVLVGLSVLVADKAMDAQANEAKDLAESSHKWATSWQDLYKRATSHRNALASATCSREEHQEVMNKLHAEKASLDCSSLPTDDESYEKERRKLNSWWYQTEAERHKSFGWDPEKVPKS